MVIDMGEVNVLFFFILCLLVYGVSLLTFFSGFGLGTLLLPFIALFFPIEIAIIYTALIHFLNNIWKMILLRKSISLKVVLLFGLPAIGGAILGASLLVYLSELEPIYTYEVFEYPLSITFVKLIIGLILILIGFNELTGLVKAEKIIIQHVPFGGLVSGFFGGLSGLQGAFRSYFLINLGLDKYGFIASSAVIAFLVDLSRLTIYLTSFQKIIQMSQPLLGTIIIFAALLGILTGNLLLEKVKMESIHNFVSYLLVFIGSVLSLGVI